jgi:hypothetical protein
MTVTSVRLAPEWGTDPLWVDGDNWGVEETAAELALPADLVERIERWDEQYQDLYDPEDPAGSGFPDTAAETRWQERGRQLARELAAAVGPGIEVRLSAAGARETIQVRSANG